MGALFPPWSDPLLRGFALALVLGGAAALTALLLYVRTPYNDQRADRVEQPVAFDHRHHVRDDGIDCRYCHTTVESSSTAGMPATELCMGCHAQIWNQSEKLALVRASFFQNTPIRWNRVHDLPDFVFFNHSVHVHAGVGCAACHGDVANMPLVAKVNSFSMGFCLDCHRHPETRVPGYERRNTERVSANDNLLAHAGAPVLADPLATCSTCHR
jgi:predicted CXXCH cytochrome family protein